MRLLQTKIEVESPPFKFCRSCSQENLGFSTVFLYVYPRNYRRIPKVCRDEHDNDCSPLVFPSSSAVEKPGPCTAENHVLQRQQVSQLTIPLRQSRAMWYVSCFSIEDIPIPVDRLWWYDILQTLAVEQTMSTYTTSLKTCNIYIYMFNHTCCNIHRMIKKIYKAITIHTYIHIHM